MTLLLATDSDQDDVVRLRLEDGQTLAARALGLGEIPFPLPTLGYVVIRPLDGVSDDSARLHALMAANAYKNALLMLPGLHGEHWKILAPFVTPSGTTIIGTNATVIDAAYVGGSLGDGIFNVVGNESGTTIALAASNVVGSNQVSMVSAPTIGAFYLITKTNTGNLLGSVYQVTAVSGAGPFTVTLDENVVYSFTSADRAQLLSPSADYPRGVGEDVTVIGNGMTLNSAISGGSIVIENLCAQNCYYENLFINLITNSQQNAVTCDTGSRDVIVRRMKIQCTQGLGNQGIWCQGNRHSIEDNVVANDNTSIGVTLISSANCLAKGNRVYGGSFGFVVGSDGNPTTYDAVGLNNTFVGNFSYGCGVGLAITSSLRTQVVGHQSIGDSDGCQVYGTTSAPPAPVPKGTLIQDLSLISPINIGLIIEPGVIGLCIDGIDCSTGTSANGAISWQGNARLSNVVARDVGVGATAHFIQQGSTGSGELNGFTAEVVAPGGDLMLISGELRVSGGNIDLDTPNAVPISVQAGGKLFIERVKLGGTQAASAIVFVVAATGTLRFGPANDFTACPFVAQVTAGGQVSFVQDQGEKVVTATTGTANLNFSDSVCQSIKCNGALTADLAVVIFGVLATQGANVAGYTGVYALDNSTSGAHNVTFEGPSGTGFTVAQGKRAMGYIDSATGNLVRVSPDT